MPIVSLCGTVRSTGFQSNQQALQQGFTSRSRWLLQILGLMHLKDEIPLEVRDKLGLKVGTCGICRDVCPHNKNLKINYEDKMPDEEIYPELIPMMNMCEDEYEQRYGAVMFSVIMGGSRYLRRNVAVALGNSGSKKALPCLEIAAKDEDQLVRSHAEWAIEKIKGP